MKFPACSAALTALGLFAAPLCADEPAIRKFLAEYVEAFNDESLEALAPMWSAEAVHVDRETGERTEGREQIMADLNEVFAANGLRLSASIERVRIIKPDVASVDGMTTVSNPDEDPQVAQFSALLVKQEDAWQIDTLEEMAAPNPAPGQGALQPLDWLVGSWVDSSGDVPVISQVQWSSTGAFLVRKFGSQVDNEVTPLGTQVIGWDPRSREIRSWLFNADGSFGDGVWSQNGNDWIIKSTQTLVDGRAASATVVLTPGEGSMQVQRVSHTIAGTPVASTGPVRMLRVPEPAADEAADEAADAGEVKAAASGNSAAASDSSEGAKP